MSSTIEFKRFILESEPVGMFRDRFLFGFAEAGSSNLFDERGRIARSTSLLVIQRGYRFMQRIVEIATDCEGGMLKMSGRQTTPEGYIAAWRKALKQALPLSHYLEYGNLDIDFRSLVDALQARRRQLDLGSAWQRKTARELDDLIIRVCTTPGVNETTEHWMDEVIPVTQVSITQSNLDSILGLLEAVFDRIGTSLQVWRSHFSVYAWQQGCYSRQAQEAVA